MVAVTYGGFGGYFALLRDVVLRLPVLKRPAIRDVLARQIHVAGVATLSALVVRAAGLGTIIIAYITDILGGAVEEGAAFFRRALVVAESLHDMQAVTEVNELFQAALAR